MGIALIFSVIPEAGVSGVDIIETIEKSTWVVNLTLFILLVLSVISWGIIVYKFIQLRKAREMTRQFAKIMEGNYNYPDIYNSSSKLTESPAAAVFRKGYEELEALREAVGTDGEPEATPVLMKNIERSMKKQGSTHIAVLDDWLSMLAITATASPFLGLFGTVWGIMNAFDIIGKTGSATLGTIAPSLAEALITTAFGLVAAIPAVVFYNLFSSSITKRQGEAAEVITEFLNYINRRHAA